MKQRSLWLAAAAMLTSSLAKGQQSTLPPTDSEYYNQIRTNSTAVPFLLISPDARAGAMGDVGVSTLPDANSIHWNAAKIAFLEKDQTLLSLSYTPWLSRLVPDIDLAYLSFVKKIGDRQGIGVSLRYFSLGEVQFRDANGNAQGTFNPYEFAIDGAYSLKFSEQWSGAVALRYIFSDLTRGSASGLNTKAGQSVAADLSVFYQSRQFTMEGGQRGQVRAGLNISNMGAKIDYTEQTGSTDFLPTNLRLGGSFAWDLDRFNQLIFAVEANKLLVPTPPVRNDSTGEVRFGKDDNVDFISGMLQSFNDAPGGGKEEFREVVWNTGVEYWYDKTFAVRGGYQYEHRTKGNRQYFTIGAGLKWNVFQLDFAYLFPANQTVRSPIENTLRFTLIFDFDALAKGQTDQ